MDGNPILNSPYDEPKLHYHTNEKGEIDYSQIIEGRRVFVPDLNAMPSRQGPQGEIFEVNDLAGDYSSHLVNLIRKEVGVWRKSGYPNTTRVTKELLIFHSDRGVQNADMAFRKLCAQHRILRSMSRKGDCWDNAVAESFFKNLKSEAIFGISLLELNFAQRVLFEWIEITYNRYRRHSALNHLSIPEFKESFLTSNLAA